MPELPEVETVCRGLAPAMEGATILDVEQRRPDLRFPLPNRFAARLVGQRVARLWRRAKFLVADLSGGESLIMHLGMSGRFTISPTHATPDKRKPRALAQFVTDTGGIAAHDHIVFAMSSGQQVTFNDPRRFGYMDLVDTADLASCKHLVNLGVEPLSNGFHADYLAAKARGKSADVKAFLLDQRTVAGLGNIYVCEALFRAGISPKRKAGTLATANGRPAKRTEQLVPAIRDVLTEAIAAGGSTLRDYADANGALGYFQHTFRVYGQADAPCQNADCGRPIRRIVQAGRSTFYCSACQR
ncbi:MAG: bifunctional DNA-formamidopyrimidine glycosylase/DNA-(apurinic or apyrimidinic site) lyase [Pseudomonadota bacterium]